MTNFGDLCRNQAKWCLSIGSMETIAAILETYCHKIYGFYGKMLENLLYSCLIKGVSETNKMSLKTQGEKSMELNGSSNIQPMAAGMSLYEQAQAIERALRNAKKDTVLVEDDHCKICLKDGQLLMNQPRAGKGWTCRKITAKRLVMMAPAMKIIEVLKEA